VIKYVLGIDPGWSGGAALLTAEGAHVSDYNFSRMTEADIIESISDILYPDMVCYIEKVGPMPKQGVVSVFKFGQIYGLLRGLCISRIRTIEVLPQVWQKSLGCLTHGDKNVSKAAAQRLFPGMKITHATADALLIAYYGYTKERQIQPHARGEAPAREGQRESGSTPAHGAVRSTIGTEGK
jgi:crossover junction endodeoxyribonuclease RuvC